MKICTICMKKLTEHLHVLNTWIFRGSGSVTAALVYKLELVVTSSTLGTQPNLEC